MISEELKLRRCDFPPGLHGVLDVEVHQLGAGARPQQTDNQERAVVGCLQLLKVVILFDLPEDLDQVAIEESGFAARSGKIGFPS